ncbi:hypothetical protein L596_021859 [Steinernema carpocapsae]|uniref:Uncharacterized protein n=1 Tax=Steinernema carpocapsae TaxID=34508 RepID=A0A4V6A014_STECR|nr:hypothetical protein L596_021859 [Steinernema carpocapsae]
MTVDLLKLKSNPRAPGQVEELQRSTLPWEGSTLSSEGLRAAPDAPDGFGNRSSCSGHGADSVGRPATMNLDFPSLVGPLPGKWDPFEG